MPLALWGIGCIALGVHAAQQHAPDYPMPMWLSPLVGFAAMIMHLAWSAGFWLHVAQRPFLRNEA